MIGLEDLGSAAVQGLVLGIIAAFVFNFASRVIKILLIVQFIILKWLESRRIVIVDWSKISFGLIDETDLVQQADSLLASLIETGSFGAAAIIGFMVTKSLIKS
ncbi:MAG: FUN14 domain-containing protein [Candidatus Poseidoniaceae archaeon]|nr:FUN14 domain-containing protein [Candidatus Poseidoniaceae archaeon]